MSVFKYEKDSDGIVTITMDQTGPVNAMNDEYDQAMRATVDRLESEQGMTGVVIASAKKTFFAGGDLNGLVAVEPGNEGEYFRGVEDIKSVLRRMEKLPVPVVAAINGAAMGGGFEICLCCNHRVLWNNKAAQVGLPEVTLGLLPGGGGVVRMTNLLGIQNAMPYLLEGKRVGGEEALKAGLVDELVDDLADLVPAAKRWILANKDNENAAVQPWDRKGHKIPGGGSNSPQIAGLIGIGAAMLRQKTRGLLPAPEYIMNIMVEAGRLDFDTALRIEGRHFANLVTTPQAKNMISTFFFGMNKVNGGGSRPKDIERKKVTKVGILGAGMMGQGIAYSSAMAGIQVVLKDMSQEAADKGKAYTDRLLSKRVEKGRMDEAKKAAVLDLITPTDKLEDLQGCDLIIEAVFENMELKHKVTKETEGYLAADGVWGSNTSSLPITRLAEASSKPENFIGIHFFSPVDKMPLVEIICGEKTSDETLALAFDYTQQIRKTPIVVNDSVGFYTSRTIGTQLSEATQILTEGVHPARIENGSKAIGMPAGAFTLMDEIGYELSVTLRKSHLEMGLVKADDDKTPDATALTLWLVEQGRIGRKAGKGIFDWSEGGKKLSAEVTEKYYRPDVEMDQQDLQDRLLFRPVIESIKCLEEGVLRTFEDGNIGSIMGIGAPAWTGGYLQFVNTYGVQRFVERCNELAAQFGPRFAPPQMAVEKAAKGELFS